MVLHSTQTENGNGIVICLFFAIEEQHRKNISNSTLEYKYSIFFLSLSVSPVSFLLNVERLWSLYIDFDLVFKFTEYFNKIVDLL